MKKLLWLILALAIVGGGVVWYLYQKPVASVAKKKPDASLTAAELISGFQNNEAAAMQEYLDKIIEVSGTIHEIIPGEDLEMQVVLRGADATSNVSCVLEEKHERFLERNLKKDDQVRIKGRCTGANSDMLGMQVILDRAVIVE